MRLQQLSAEVRHCLPLVVFRLFCVTTNSLNSLHRSCSTIPPPTELSVASAPPPSHAPPQSDQLNCRGWCFTAGSD